MTIPAYLLSNAGCERNVCHATGCPEAVKENPATGRFFITMGHPGFNSPANNGSGYATAAKALASVRKYSRKADDDALNDFNYVGSRHHY